MDSFVLADSAALAVATAVFVLAAVIEHRQDLALEAVADPSGPA